MKIEKVEVIKMKMTVEECEALIKASYLLEQCYKMFGEEGQIRSQLSGRTIKMQDLPKMQETLTELADGLIWDLKK